MYICMLLQICAFSRDHFYNAARSCQKKKKKSKEHLFKEKDLSDSL